MKRLCLLLLVVALLICVGCVEPSPEVLPSEEPSPEIQWSDEKGYIYRHDIEPGDFAFLFDEWDYEPGMSEDEYLKDFYYSFRRDTIKPEDIFDALGLPFSISDPFGVIDYTYIFGEGFDAFTIYYYPNKDEIDYHPSIDSVEGETDKDNLFMSWSLGAHITDTEKYKMYKRFDIREEELSFIDENTTSIGVQRAFGAPHYYIEGYKPEKETNANAFVYDLKNGNVFKIIYYRDGYILWAWVEDKDGKEIKLLAKGDNRAFHEDFLSDYIN